MLKEFAGRKVIPTTLDPIPPLFRAVPGHIVMNALEARKLASGDGPTFKFLIAICSTEDALDLRRRHREKPKRRSRKR